MKKAALIGLSLLAAAMGLNAQGGEFPKLTGPYLGQIPPVDEPVLFAPGIVSTGEDHCSAALGPDGQEIYWELGIKIGFSKLENGRWTEPEVVSFCKGDPYRYGNPFISPDGKKMFFTTMRPGAVSEDKENIWYAERTASGWADPTPVSPEVNALSLHWSISVSGRGTLYFQGTSEDSYGGMGDIYYAELVGGAHAAPVNAGPAINTKATETCPYVAPDESYIVFTRIDQTDPANSGIFISYKDKAGRWRPAVMLTGGSRDKGGLSPKITPDGKYLFYVNGGMFWMPARLIEDMRPKGPR
jgi:Tol biopolymer transport system component